MADISPIENMEELLNFKEQEIIIDILFIITKLFTCL